jgi:hypothetical protein
LRCNSSRDTRRGSVLRTGGGGGLGLGGAGGRQRRARAQATLEKDGFVVREVIPQMICKFNTRSKRYISREVTKAAFSGMLSITTSFFLENNVVFFQEICSLLGEMKGPCATDAVAYKVNVVESSDGCKQQTTFLSLPFPFAPQKLNQNSKATVLD